MRHPISQAKVARLAVVSDLWGAGARPVFIEDRAAAAQHDNAHVVASAIADLRFVAERSDAFVGTRRAALASRLFLIIM